MTFYDLYVNGDLFIWVLLRLTAFFFASPLFGRKEIPSMVKVGLSAVLAYVIVLSGRAVVSEAPNGMGEYILICIRETMRGFAAGYISSVVFSIFSSVGRLLDTAIGFQMAELYDPVYGGKSSVSSNLLNLSAFIVFLLLRGDLHVIKILADSYKISPIGRGLDLALLSDVFISAFSFAVLLTLKIALPVLIITLLTEAIMGIMLKFIPQINIFVVGIPLKIIIGLFAIFYFIPPLSNVFQTVFDSVYYFAGQIGGV